MEHEEAPILGIENQKDVEMAIASEKNTVLPIAPNGCTGCAFAVEENGALESKERSKSATKLCGLMLFYLIAVALEIIGGVKANSLSVLTDAAHLLTDVAGFIVSLFAVWASGWEATSHQSFGFSRLEVLGALLSVQLIWLISGILIYEAVGRILDKNTRVNGGIMFAVAAFGFFINLFMVLWLGHDHSHHSCHNHHLAHHHSEEHDEEGTKLVSGSPSRKILNINIQGAYLHVMADLIQSVGVMIAGAILWAKPDWFLVDLICTIVFSAFVLSTTLPMLSDIFNILMDGTPKEVNIITLTNGLKCVKGVQDIHDLHVWAVTSGKLALSCHVVAEPGASSTEILNNIRHYCEETCRIRHVTVQIEQ